MTVFNVGDEVVYTSKGIWNGAEGIVLTAPRQYDFNSRLIVRIKLSKIPENVSYYKVGHDDLFYLDNWELSYLKYDPSQQIDSDDDI